MTLFDKESEDVVKITENVDGPYARWVTNTRGTVTDPKKGITATAIQIGNKKRMDKFTNISLSDKQEDLRTRDATVSVL